MLAHIKDVLDGLNVDYQVERSFKFRKNEFLDKRFLVGIPTVDLSESKIQTILGLLESSPRVANSIMANLDKVNRIFIGVEACERKHIRKLYLEFWDEIVNEILNAETMEAKRTPRCIHQGFKWDSQQAEVVTQTDYIYHPMLSLSGMEARLRQIYEDDSSLGFRSICSLLAFSRSKLHDNDSLFYIEAQENDSPRKSYDINFYKAGIRLKQIGSILKANCDYFGISSEKFASPYREIHNHTLGHVSGGAGRQGEEFLTYYHA